MAEEHRCQAPQLCANNCGFFGSPATLNLCSKCYRDLQLKDQQSSSAKLALNQTLAPSQSVSVSVSSPSPAAALRIPETKAEEKIEREAEEKGEGGVAQPNRCMACRKRVGLTGFKCRCGMTFCGTHRYAEKHDCTFDFKSREREAIAKANPVIKADKLRKI